MRKESDEAKIRAALDLLRRRHEKRALGDAEAALAETAPHTWPPPPGSVHPALTQWYSAAQRFITRGDHHFLLPKPIRVHWALTPEPSAYPEIETAQFDIHHYWGMAPYVGDPFVYTWRVAVDPHQRWIAEQEAALTYVGEQP